MIWEFPRCFENILKTLPGVKQGALKHCTAIRVDHVGDIVGVEPLNGVANRYRKLGWVVNHILHAHSMEMNGMGRRLFFGSLIGRAGAEKYP